MRLEGRRLALPRAGRPRPRRSRFPRPPARAEPEPDRPGRVPLRRARAAATTSSGCAPPTPSASSPSTGGVLRLIGRESVGSWFEQALVARRQEHHAYRAETRLAAFAPDTYQQSAGLTTYYNRSKFHFLAVTHEAGVGRVLTILSCPGDWPDGRLSFPLHPPDPAPRRPGRPRRRGHAAPRQQFFWRAGGEWQPAGPALDASVISDEGGRGEHGSFTGAFVGMLAFDTSGRARPADFASFSYVPADLR